MTAEQSLCRLKEQLDVDMQEKFEHLKQLEDKLKQADNEVIQLGNKLDGLKKTLEDKEKYLTEMDERLWYLSFIVPNLIITIL